MMSFAFKMMNFAFKAVELKRAIGTAGEAGAGQGFARLGTWYKK